MDDEPGSGWPLLMMAGLRFPMKMMAYLPCLAVQLIFKSLQVHSRRAAQEYSPRRKPWEMCGMKSPRGATESFLCDHFRRPMRSGAKSQKTKISDSVGDLRLRGNVAALTFPLRSDDRGSIFVTRVVEAFLFPDAGSRVHTKRRGDRALPSPPSSGNLH